MNPRQVSALLTTEGLDGDTAALFHKFNVTGKMILDGISEQDLEEMGFKTSFQRRGIVQILKQLSNKDENYVSQAPNKRLFLLEN